MLGDRKKVTRDHFNLIFHGRIAPANLFGYAEGDPLNFSDPLGLERVNKPYPLPPPLPEDSQLCKGRLPLLWQLKNEAESWAVNDKWKHCYLGCEIAKACGNAGNFAAAAGKEVGDAVANAINWLKRSPERRQVEREDYDATRQGVPCASQSVGCDCCCRRYYQP